MSSSDLDEFLRQRPRLFALAYRMLGSASEAEDAVQETYLRWAAAETAEIRSAEAWLTTVTVNLCRSWLVSARARRESYVGPWLPEPVPTPDTDLGPLETAQQRELVSLALLAALERLNPVERAVFVLREAFGYPHREIAAMLELSEANSQQIYSRASVRVREGRGRFEVSVERARELLERFLAAAGEGDVAGLRALLAADVVATSDGGGVVSAARRPVTGADRVSAFLLGLVRKAPAGFTLEATEVNGAPGLLARVDGAVYVVVVPEFGDFQDGPRLVALSFVLNPAKLGRFR
ncbi:RNA polymerase sigma-70 factor [Nocardia sp. NPDC050697]|uniref:RNA polymerase sigma-70 factor n=1 Tax=Nocardia sp. NPDC050697 TaxID=3155158 RepID=UPI0033EE2EB6